jgi:diacylglycerol kinase (ATP)
MTARNKFGRTEAGYRPALKVRHAVDGLVFSIRQDFSVTYKVLLSAIILVSSFLLREWLNFAMVFVVTGLVLAAELFNTAIEALCDVVQPDRDERIGVVKDVAAAAAGITIVMWAAVVGYEYWRLARWLLA